jgi:hypothetical protein
MSKSAPPCISTGGVSHSVHCAYWYSDLLVPVGR